MKKLATILIGLLIAATAFCQFPNTQFLGNSSTLIVIRGAARIDSGMVIGNFADTTTASLGPWIKTVPYIRITVAGTTTYMRNGTANAWINLTPTLQQVFNTEVGGSVLTKDDSIQSGSNILKIFSSSVGLYGINSSGGTGIVGQTTDGNGVYGISTTGFAIRAASTSSYGVFSESTDGISGHFRIDKSSNNTIGSVMEIARVDGTAGSGANGIGGSIDFLTQANTGTLPISNQLISKWTNATFGTRTSQFDLTGVNNTTTETFANFQTAGIVRVNNLADTLATKSYARDQATTLGVFTFGGSLRWASVDSFGGDPTGVANSTAAAQAAIATGRPTYFGYGRYKIEDTLKLSPGQAVFGVGRNNTEIITTSNINIIKSASGNARNWINGIRFVGTGKGVIPGGVFTPQNAIWFRGNKNLATNCIFDSLNGYGIISYHESGTIILSNMAANCQATNSTGILFNVVSSEYGFYTNLTCDTCFVAYYDRASGNNTYHGIGGNWGTEGFRLRNTGNGDHGTVDGFKFNHNSTDNIKVEGSDNGFTFTNGDCFSGNIDLGTIDTARNIRISNVGLSNTTINGQKCLRCDVNDNYYVTAVVHAGSGISYYNNQNSTDPTVANPDSVIFSQAAGYYRFTNMTSTIDTLTYKSVGMDANGKIVRFNSQAQASPLRLTVGTTPISNGSTTNILYNNAGVLGEYTITGTGTTIPTSTTPTFTTSIIAPLGIGSTAANGTITFQGNNAGAGNTGTNANFIVRTGNTPTNRFIIDNNGEFGFNTATASGITFFGVTLGNNAATTAKLTRNSSSQNIEQINDLGSWWIGNQSLATNQVNVYGHTLLGNPVGGAVTPTSYLNLGIGAAGASNSPMKYGITGAALQTVPEIGASEVLRNRLYYVDSTANRYTLYAGGIPTITAGVGAGSSPTISISGRDQDGFITVTTGTIPTLSATVATVIFNQLWEATPKCVLLTPANSNAAALSGVNMVWVDQAGITTQQFAITAGTTALIAATTYQWYYRVFQ